jgi:hypothetical protein
VDAHPKHAVALGAAWIASGATAEPPAPERVKGRATPPAAPVSPVMPMSPVAPMSPVPPVAKPVVPAQRVAPVSPVAATVITASPLAPRPEPVRSSGVAPTIPMRAETVRSAPERPRQHVPVPPVYSDRSGDSRGRSRAPVLAGVAVGLVIALSVLAFVLLKDKDRHKGGGVDLGSIGTNDVTTPATSNPPTSDTPPTTAPPPPVSYPKTPSAYAVAATKAWATGDTVRLGQLSDPDNAVFATLSAGDYNRAFALFKCTDDAGLNTCVFYNKFGDQLNLVVQNDLVGSAHAVVDGKFTQITFPDDPKAYAQEALDDWQSHNKAAVSLLTGKPGDSAFSAIPDGRRNDTWTYDHEEGATGHVFYIWKNAAGESIAISFPTSGSVTNPPNRHGLIETVYFMPPP